jgi:hypothetical protein
MRVSGTVLLVAVVVGLLASGPGVASADLIASDSFNYTVGNSLNGATGGTGWSDAWSGDSTPIIGSGLNYTGVGSAGGSVDATAGGWLMRSLSSSVGTGSIYIGVLGHGVTPASSTGWGGVSLYYGSAEGEGFGTKTVSGSNHWDLQKVMGGSYASSVTQDATTTFMVMKVIFGGGSGGNDLIHVWMNPNPSVTPLDTSTDIDGQTAHHVITKLGLGGSSDAKLTLDELRIGTTYADVIGTPEPSVVTLLTTGLIGLLAYAWRKRR